jgi:LuxR family transcriptional regulator, maltose regulon positive regulatory protein
MTDSDVRQRADRLLQTGGPAYDLVAAKLMRPLVRPGTVRRSSLIERLARDDARSVVSVVAPAGYGKTTLLSQWAERGGQAFAWVSVGEGDDDPKVLLRYVAEALDAVEPIDRRVFDALASPTSSVPGSVVPRLGHAFSSMSAPVVLVLDDVHLVRDSECRAALSVLADHVGAGSRLAFAGRDEPPVRVARLRAEGRVLEIGPGDLSLTREEASLLLRAAEVALGEDDVAELHRRTEGWAAGLYLAALYLREGGTSEEAAASFGGDDRFVSEYMESELLARISQQQRVFLTQTAALERMSGPLCEAVLELPGSAAALAELARSNLLLVPLDRRGQWYRYHHLFRDMLLAELERTEPGLIPVLRRRAAGWYLRNGLPEEALEYSIAAGDIDTAARLVEQLWLQADRHGHYTTIQRWLRWLEARGGIEGNLMLAIVAAFAAMATGRPVEAERWADVVDRWQYQGPGRPGDHHGPDSPDDPAAEAWAAVLRALMCRGGVEQMYADAGEAAQKFAAQNIAVPTTALYQGIARILCGDLDGGDALLEDAVRGAEDSGTHDVLAIALPERSLVAVARHQWDRAEAFASRARSVMHRAGIEDIYATPLVCVAQARVALHRGDLPTVHQELVTAQRLRHLLTYALPPLAVRARIEMIRIHLALADLAGARTLMQEVDDLLKRRPGLGTLAGEAAALRALLAKQRGLIVPGPSALTAAELRVLPMLATHLPMHEIAAEMYLSPHTVRTQAKSVYRKLGATTRTQAVAQARELGLLEG